MVLKNNNQPIIKKSKWPLTYIYQEIIKKVLINPNGVVYHDIYNNKDYTYIDLYKMIEIRKKNLQEETFLIVTNSIESIVDFIAMMERGIIPIIIDNYESGLRNDFEKGIYDEHERFQALKKKIVCNGPIDLIKKEEVKFIKKYFSGMENHSLNNLNDYLTNIDLSVINYTFEKPSFAITTSGTMGSKIKLIQISEEDIFNKVCDFTKGNTDVKTSYICSNIAGISGIIGCVYSPLINGKKLIIDSLGSNIKQGPDIAVEKEIFQILKRYSVNELTVPIDFFKYFDYKFYKKINSNIVGSFCSGGNVIYFDYIKKINVTGSVGSYDKIEQLRKQLNGLNDNVFYNVYGMTETLGPILSSNEKDFCNVYIYLPSLFKNKIIYTYDKNTFYELDINGNSNKITFEYDEYLFIQCISVGKKDNRLIIEKRYNAIGEILIDQEKVSLAININDDKFQTINDKKYYKTNDLAINIEGNIYILGRKTENNLDLKLSLLEIVIFNLTNIEVICTYSNGVVDVIVKSNYIYIDSVNDLIKFSNDIDKLNSCLTKLSQKLNVQINKPLFICSEEVDSEPLLHKLSKQYIRNNIFRLKKIGYQGEKLDIYRMIERYILFEIMMALLTTNKEFFCNCKTKEECFEYVCQNFSVRIKKGKQLKFIINSNFKELTDEFFSLYIDYNYYGTYLSYQRDLINKIGIDNLYISNDGNYKNIDINMPLSGLLNNFFSDYTYHNQSWWKDISKEINEDNLSIQDYVVDKETYIRYKSLVYNYLLNNLNNQTKFHEICLNMFDKFLYNRSNTLPEKKLDCFRDDLIICQLEQTRNLKDFSKSNYREFVLHSNNSPLLIEIDILQKMYDLSLIYDDAFIDKYCERALEREDGIWGLRWILGDIINENIEKIFSLEYKEIILTVECVDDPSKVILVPREKGKKLVKKLK